MKAKTALVSGANRGIGLETVRQLAQRGYAVVLGARVLKKGSAAAESLRREGLEVLPVALDVADAESIVRAVAEAVEAFGRLDVLVNNAGINYDTWHNAASAD